MSDSELDEICVAVEAERPHDQARAADIAESSEYPAERLRAELTSTATAWTPPSPRPPPRSSAG